MSQNVSGLKLDAERDETVKETTEPSIPMMRLDAGSTQGTHSVSPRSKLRPLPRLQRQHPERSSPPFGAPTWTVGTRPASDDREFEHFVDELRALGFEF